VSTTQKPKIDIPAKRDAMMRFDCEPDDLIKIPVFRRLQIG
jgi:hypothetical protein